MMLGVVSAVAAIAVVALLVWALRWRASAWMKDQITQAIGSAQTQLVTGAQQQLAAQRAGDVQELEMRKQAVEHAVTGLTQHLAKAETLIRELERDRAAKFGSLSQQLSAQVRETQKWAVAAEQLTSVLGNAKVRGQWGQKAADDILRACGLQEGLHYVQEKASEAGRPDFTFLLPDGHRLYMDVKFPLDNYLKHLNSRRDEDKEQFLHDVRVHLKEMERRDYAPTEGGSPDFVLIFIPNEQVFAALNEWMPGLIDETLPKRLILCGPWALYAQVRVIWEGWQHFHHEQAIGQIVRTIGEFLKAYEGFQKRFEELGKKLGAATEHYQEIERISYAQMKRRIEQIEAYRKGQGLELDVKPSIKEEGSDALLFKEVAP